MNYKLLMLLILIIPLTTSLAVNIPIEKNKFIDLIDTPSSYIGSAGLCAVVNAGETTLEFGACGSGGITLDQYFTNATQEFYPLNSNPSGYLTSLGSFYPHNQDLNTTSQVKFSSVNATNFLFNATPTINRPFIAQGSGDIRYSIYSGGTGAGTFSGYEILDENKVFKGGFFIDNGDKSKIQFWNPVENFLNSVSGLTTILNNFLVEGNSTFNGNANFTNNIYGNKRRFGGFAHRGFGASGYVNLGIGINANQGQLMKSSGSVIQNFCNIKITGITTQGDIDIQLRKNGVAVLTTTTPTIFSTGYVNIISVEKNRGDITYSKSDKLQVYINYRSFAGTIDLICGGEIQDDN